MGPVVSIVLGREPTDGDRVSVEQLFPVLGKRGTEGLEANEVWIQTTKPIGGTYEGEPRLFAFEWQTERQEDFPARRARLAERFGVTPFSCLAISAGMNRAVDHRVLGEVALHLGRVLGGVIDFDGALLPSALRLRFDRVSWQEIAELVREFVDVIPGKVVTIEYRVSEERQWACHVGDCEFMEGWLQHPEFHLIK